MHSSSITVEVYLLWPVKFLFGGMNSSYISLRMDKRLSAPNHIVKCQHHLYHGEGYQLVDPNVRKKPAIHLHQSDMKIRIHQ